MQTPQRDAEADQLRQQSPQQISEIKKQPLLFSYDRRQFDLPTD
jgi:hypothetical protein